MKRIIVVIIAVILAPTAAFADAAGPPPLPDFDSVTQDGESVRVIINSNSWNYSISIVRLSPEDSLLLVDNVSINSLDQIGCINGADSYDYYYYYDDCHLVVDDCVPPGETTYIVYKHTDGGSCEEEDTITLTVEDVGQQCPATNSDATCDDPASGCGCSVTIGSGERVLPFAMLLIGASLLLISRRKRR